MKFMPQDVSKALPSDAVKMLTDAAGTDPGVGATFSPRRTKEIEVAIVIVQRQYPGYFKHDY